MIEISANNKSLKRNPPFALYYTLNKYPYCLFCEKSNSSNMTVFLTKLLIHMYVKTYTCQFVEIQFWLDFS